MAEGLIFDVINIKTNTFHFGLAYAREHGETYIVCCDSSDGEYYIGSGAIVTKAIFVGRDLFSGVILLKTKNYFEGIDQSLLAYGLRKGEISDDCCMWIDLYGCRVKVDPSFEQPLDKVQGSRLELARVESITTSPIYSTRLNRMIGMVINKKVMLYPELMEAILRIRRCCPAMLIDIKVKPFTLSYTAVYSGGMVDCGGLIVLETFEDIPRGSIIIAPVKDDHIDYGERRPGEYVELTFYGGTVKRLKLQLDERKIDIDTTSCFLDSFMRT